MADGFVRRVLSPALLGALLFFPACSSPPDPPELKFAEVLRARLMRMEAPAYDEDGFRRYMASTEAARVFFEEHRRPGLRVTTRREEAIERLRGALEEGDLYYNRVLDLRRERASRIRSLYDGMRRRIGQLSHLTRSMNEGRQARTHLTRAEVCLQGVPRVLAREEFSSAEQALGEAQAHLGRARNALQPLVARYTDSSQIARWRDLYARAVADAKSSGAPALVVFKFDREMVLYRNGRPQKTYQVGLGRNGLSDKVRNGDNATPEGRYKIAKKNPNSAYNKALVIDYPNDEDRRRYAQMVRKGQIRSGTGIGSLVEIHGGGKDSVTYGCVCLDDRDMDELYRIVGVGTPVTIVGLVERHDLLEDARRY